MYHSGGNVDNEEAVCVFGGGREAGGIWEISVSSFQLCCEPKTALTKFLIKEKKGNRREITYEKNLGI